MQTLEAYTACLGNMEERRSFSNRFPQPTLSPSVCTRRSLFFLFRITLSHFLTRFLYISFSLFAYERLNLNYQPRLKKMWLVSIESPSWLLKISCSFPSSLSRRQRHCTIAHMTQLPSVYPPTLTSHGSGIFATFRHRYLRHLYRIHLFRSERERMIQPGLRVYSIL